MDHSLSEQEIRVLGSLMEKAMTTPDYYPLSLNALTNACNQKSNRNPVVNWDEETILEALNSLENEGLVNESTVGRVPKYEETFTRKHNMVQAEAAVLCVLFLRGPQTPGAIRSRTDRLHTFDNLSALQETLEQLIEWGHVRQLQRLPGHKESRYMHQLGIEEKKCDDKPDDPISVTTDAQSDRLDDLEAGIQSIKSELADLKAAFDAFQKQF